MSTEKPIVNLEGKSVAIGPQTREHLLFFHRWFNDFETLRTLLRVPRPFTLEQQTARYDEIQKSERDACFTIYEREGWRPIGACGLHAIDAHNRIATFGIVIGEKSARGKGYGTETTGLVVDYGFHQLGLQNILLSVHEYNAAGRRAYEKAGFKEIGRRRKSHWQGGAWHDEVLMDCVPSDKR